MTSPRTLPQWLTQATAQHQPQPATSGASASDASDAKPVSSQLPAPGQIRRLDPMDASTTASRLVLIVRTEPQTAAAQVVLLSNEVENGTDTDLVLPGRTTGLAFELLALTDVTGPAWYVQFGPPLVTVEANVLDNVRSQPAGLPVEGPEDPRWQWKQDEHDALMALIGECARQVIDEGPDAVIDPAALDLTLVTESELALMVQATAPLLAQHRACVPLSALRRLDAHKVSPRSRAWDAVRCLLELLPRRTHLIVRDGSGSSDDLEGVERFRKPQSQRDDLPLALQAAFSSQPDTYRSLRLLTLDSLWTAAQPPQTGGENTTHALREVGPGVWEVFIAGQRHQLLIQSVERSAERVEVTDAAPFKSVGGLVHA